MATVTRKPQTRVIKKTKSRKSLLRRIFSPVVLGIFGFLLVVGIGVFGYFYHIYSQMIDARLRGDIIIRTTGIYATPHSIRNGQAISLAWVKTYLDNLGYVEEGKDADAKRGRYKINGNTIEIRSSSEAIINGSRQFPNISIIFAGGKSISKITDLDTKKISTVPCLSRKC